VSAVPDREHRADRPHEETGSALALFVAGFLAVLLLTGICVDTTLVFLGHREIVNAANAAANDAVSGIDLNTYYGAGDYAVAGESARRLADATWGQTTHDQVANLQIDAPRILGPTRVEVTAHGDVHLLFARAFPFVRSIVKVHASATAEAQDQPQERYVN
jgi:Flp pilus assembly protein TadG